MNFTLAMLMLLDQLEVGLIRCSKIVGFRLHEKNYPPFFAMGYSLEEFKV
jgi:hypothetical protein